MNGTAHPANHLAGSLSPYLLQHLHNPVDWHPWTAETLDKARRENKLIIVSIGYAACHWCHVMEHESFANAEVAALMNAHFVSIKVDREERPDIDQVYMDAVMLMSRRGGWPLNVITLPDGQPIYGGTYFPKAQWMEVLKQLAAVWREEPGRAREYAKELTESLNAMDTQPAVNAGLLNGNELETLLKSWMSRMDRKEGGENREPKFPMPANWRMLLRAAHFCGENEVRAQVKLTLHKMALGGICDQVGGGFARYSVDGLWHVPHFEKMLYDNAQLLSLYAEAFTCFREPLYEETVRGIAAFCARELRDARGGWCSSLDADSEGVEGKFYVWTLAEVNACLKEEAAWFNEYFHITEEGNWEHGLNVLIASRTPAQFDSHKNWPAGSTATKLKIARAQLLAEREKRIRPGLDDKVIAAWNGLMVRGLCDAWLAIGENKWLQAARETFDFIRAELWRDGRLLRCYRQGHSHINGFLDDYALVADAALALFQCTGEWQYYESALELCSAALILFDHKDEPLLWYTAKDDAPLIARKKETTDNVIPAANSVMAHVLFALGTLSGDQSFISRSRQMAASVKSGLQQYPGAYAHWGSLCLNFIFPPAEVVISAPDPQPLLLEWHQQYWPGTVLLPLRKELDLALARGRFAGIQTRLYVCRNHSCQLPVHSVAEAWAQCASLPSSTLESFT